MPGVVRLRSQFRASPLLTLGSAGVIFNHERRGHCELAAAVVVTFAIDRTPRRWLHRHTQRPERESVACAVANKQCANTTVLPVYQ
jgi:hypothetical protein